MANGFIKIPRSLFENSFFQDFPHTYQLIFIRLLSLVMYEETDFVDHGVLIKLQPGQYCTTLRELADEMKMDRYTIERALSKFCFASFSRQEVRHKKTIITITYFDVYDKENSLFATRKTTKKRQESDIKEEVKNIRNIKDISNEISKSPPSEKSLIEFNQNVEPIFRPKMTQVEFDKIQAQFPQFDVKLIAEDMADKLASKDDKSTKDWAAKLRTWCRNQIKWEKKDFLKKLDYTHEKMPSNNVIKG